MTLLYYSMKAEMLDRQWSCRLVTHQSLGMMWSSMKQENACLCTPYTFSITPRVQMLSPKLFPKSASIYSTAQPVVLITSPAENS